jgi:penicillin-binding protein 2
MNALVGKEGAEKAFESYLHGTDGTAAVTSTAEGAVTSTVYTKEPEPGNNVYLTTRPFAAGGVGAGPGNRH